MEMREWSNSQLQKFLDIDSADDLVDYILQLQNDDEIRTYLSELLGQGKGVKRFIDALLEKKKNYVPSRKPEVPEDVQVYVKSKTAEEPSDRKKKKPEKKEAVEEVVSHTHNGIRVKQIKGKSKGQKEAGPRTMCDCQASEHGLISNCLSCGKIICAAEGVGACLFCEHHRQEQAQVVPTSQLDVTNATPSFEEALRHKDRLLEFDRTTAKRTVVHDDQADYYSMNEWMSAKEKEDLPKKLHDEKLKQEEEKRKNKITFDFAGRKVIADKPAAESVKDVITPHVALPTHIAVNPTLGVVAPVFVGHGTEKKSKSGKKKEVKGPASRSSRIQHEYFEEVTEE